MKPIGRRLFIMFMGTALSAGLFACGGGYDDGYTPPPPVPIISEGTMTKGSVLVNGIRFEDTLANITADDTAKTPDFLQSGMTVKVSGRRNDDGLTGTADRIEVENEVRGAVAGLSGDTFTVLGQTVVVDGGTVLSGRYFISGGTISGLANTDEVEVHGQRDTTGVIRATRVEKLGADADDEVKGVVSGLVLNTSFQIGGLTITYTGSTPIVPLGAELTKNGQVVEVHLSGAAATRIEIEDAEDDEFDPAEGQEFEVEGFVTDLTGTLPDVSFTLNGRQVLATSATRYEGGIDLDLDNDVKVEAEGHLVGGILVADKITFKESIRIESNADGAVSADTLGFTIDVTSLTDLNNLTGGIAGIAQGDGLKIRGFLNNDGVSITATRIDSTSPVASERHILQGPVSNIVASARTFEIVGITVDASNVPVNDVRDDNDQVISIDLFFASLTANRTIVKARGTFSAGTIAANEVALE